MSTTAAAPTEADRLWRGIMRLMWFDSKRLAQVLAGFDLTIPQFFTLHSIQRRGDSCRMGDLAHQMFQSSATMTGLVTRLEADGLVDRVMDPADRRAVRVRVTDRAQDVLAAVATAQRESLARILDRLDPPDRLEFLRLLDVYLEALNVNTGKIS